MGRGASGVDEQYVMVTRGSAGSDAEAIASVPSGCTRKGDSRVAGADRGSVTAMCRIGNRIGPGQSEERSRNVEPAVRRSRSPVQRQRKGGAASLANADKLLSSRRWGLHQMILRLDTFVSGASLGASVPPGRPGTNRRTSCHVHVP